MAAMKEGQINGDTRGHHNKSLSFLWNGETYSQRGRVPLLYLYPMQLISCQLSLKGLSAARGEWISKCVLCCNVFFLSVLHKVKRKPYLHSCLTPCFTVCPSIYDAVTGPKPESIFFKFDGRLSWNLIRKFRSLTVRFNNYSCICTPFHRL
jgi:hypothetical protein